MFARLALLAAETPCAGSAVYPLVILLLLVCWGLFLATAAVRLARAWRDGAIVTVCGDTVPRWRALAGLALALGVAVAVSLALSPEPPVLSTYTGLAHVGSAELIASMEWHAGFPADYPLATPVFASLVIASGLDGLSGYAMASTLLVLVGVAGTWLLAGTVLRSLLGAMVAALVVAALPKIALIAQGDSLEVGLLALAPWCILFLIDRLREEGTGRFTLLPMLGGVASLALACQARPEALAFPCVLLLGSMLTPKPGGFRAGLRCTVPVVLAAAVLVAPHGIHFCSVFLISGRMWSDVCHHLLVPSVVLALTALVVGVQVVLGSFPEVAARLDRHLLPAAGMTLAAYCGVGLALWGPQFVVPTGVCFGADCAATTFRTVPLWHFNPAMVPLPLMGLFLVGVLAAPLQGDSRLGAFLVLWGGLMLAGASLKNTGELPFEGARTQVAASVPFALLCALGAIRVVRSLPAGICRWGTLVALILPSYPAALLPLAELDYTQQQEFRILNRCAQELPPKATLYAPDDVVEQVSVGSASRSDVDLFALHRTEHMVNAIEPPGADFEVRRASALFEAEADSSVRSGTADATGAPSQREPEYFLLTLNCYRGSRAGELNPSCARTVGRFALEPVCEDSVRYAPYASDFFERTRIRTDVAGVGIYRIVGPR